MTSPDLTEVRAAIEEARQWFDLDTRVGKHGTAKLDRALAALARIEAGVKGWQSKRPVAWRVSYADGWIISQDEESATKYAEVTGSVIQGLYVRDGTLPPSPARLERSG